MPLLLLDTHALLWWLDGDERLSPDAHAAISEEITTKHRLGKLPRAADVARDVAGCVAAQGFRELPITLPDAERAGRLPGPHRDPFDRMLVAQALREDLELVSNERVFDGYGIRRLW